MFGHHHLMSEGAQIDGVILESNPSKYYRTRTRVVVGVKFEDGEKGEFTQELTDFYDPPGRLLKQAGGHSTGNNVIPLWLTAGSKIPVRYDAADRSRLAMDVDALHERALRHWVETQEAQRAQAE